ncbi:MAG: RNA-binding protein Jag [Firmicutes bacterium]|nr:RNA-binding protein Jag [Bacillota bacterium]MDI6706663.1 RNA-binding cell elongation regulator Jag/EloR [Bacillota bacterium]
MTAKSIEKTGKTIQEAVRLAIEELKVDLDDVKIDILEEPERGLLGLINSKPGKVRVTLKTTPVDTAREFLEKLLKSMNIDGRVLAKEEPDKVIKVEFKGPNMGILIGRRGQTLDAIQYITSLVVNKKFGEDYYRIIIDTENYRQKREETLVQLARNLAHKAVKLKRDIALEPMNPYERRIIHSTLQEDGRVTTASEGEDPYRKVIIKVK